MQISLFPKFASFAGTFSSRREKPVDTEMGLTPQASAAINWSGLAANRALTERILSAPPAAGEVRQFATLPAPNKAASVLKSKYWLLLAIPAVFGASYGVTTAIGNKQVAQYGACRTSACQGFANASWDIIDWNHGFPEVVSTGHGNLTQECLDHFETSVERNGSYITFNADDEFCPSPAFASFNDKAKMMGVVTGVSAFVVATAAWGMAKTKQNQIVQAGLRTAQQILFPDLLQALKQGNIATSQHLHGTLSQTLGEQLVQAAARGDNNTIEQLLAIGVPTTRSDEAGPSALVVALTHHQQEAALALSRTICEVSPADVAAAARSADVSVFLQLLNAARSQGPANYAAFLSRLDGALLSSFAVAQALAAPGLTEILQALQPDTQRFMDYQDGQGRTALHLAMFWKRAEQARALLKAGADTSLRDVFGRSVADAAWLNSVTAQDYRNII